MAVQANAQSVQLGQQLGKTQTGQAILRQLGLGANATSAELTSAMAKLNMSAAQQAALTKAITQFNQQAARGNSSSAVSRNEEIAKAIFAPKGQVLAVTALAGSASRDAVSANAEKVACDASSVASALSAGGGTSFATAEAAEKAGIIGNSKCEIKNMKSAEARKNLGRVAECMLNNGADKLAVGSVARNNIGAGCLAGALERADGAAQMLTGAQAQAAMAAFQQISTNCGYVR